MQWRLVKSGKVLVIPVMGTTHNADLPREKGKVTYVDWEGKGKKHRKRTTSKP